MCASSAKQKEGICLATSPSTHISGVATTLDKSIALISSRVGIALQAHLSQSQHSFLWVTMGLAFVSLMQEARTVQEYARIFSSLVGGNAATGVA